MKVVGVAQDQQAQALVVELPRGLPSVGPHHITVSHASGVAASYSNQLITKGYQSLNGPTLTGRIELLARSTPTVKRNPRHANPVLAVDDGPSGAAVLITADGRRILGAWGWSWDEDSKGGRGLLEAAGSGEVLTFDTMAGIGEHIAARAAQLAQGTYRLVVEETWGGGKDKRSADVVNAIASDGASQGRTVIDKRTWASSLLGLTPTEVGRDSRVWRELQDLVNDKNNPRLPRRLRKHRHTWDAYAIALYMTRR